MAYPPTKKFYKFLKADHKSIFNYFWFVFLLVDLFLIYAHYSLGVNTLKNHILTSDLNERAGIEKQIIIELVIRNNRIYIQNKQYIWFERKLKKNFILSHDLLKLKKQLKENIVLLNIDKNTSYNVVNEFTSYLNYLGFEKIVISDSKKI